MMFCYTDFVNNITKKENTYCDLCRIVVPSASNDIYGKFILQKKENKGHYVNFLK